MLPLQTVLCAFDFSDTSRSALVDAADLAERSHAALHLIHVVPLFRARKAHAGSDPEVAFRERTRSFVNDTLAAENAFDVVSPVVHEVHGETPADGVLHYAASIGADLVVVGTHSRGAVERILAGSVAAELLRRSPVPVLIVPERVGETMAGPDGPVVVGVDFSAHAAHALALARAMAQEYAAPLGVAHVRDPLPDTVLAPPDLRRTGATPSGVRSWETAHEGLEALLTPDERGSDHVALYAPPGRPAAELVEIARREGAGLLVVGTHGRQGWDRLRLGSVAEATVRGAPCPVLVVPIPRTALADETPAAEATDSSQ